MAGEWLIRKGLKIARDLVEGEQAAKKVSKFAKPAKEAVDEYDPYAVRARPSTAPGAAEASTTSPSSLIIQPTREDLAMITRPTQEKTGIFDYGFKMPGRDSGVQRYQPPRGVPQRSQDLLGRQDVFDKMVAGVERGMPVRDWYEMGPVYKSFIDEFGEQEGNLRFDAFVDAIASTSPRSDVGTNMRNATYYYGKAHPPPGTNETPSFSDLPEKAPYPYGHLAQNLHRQNVEKTIFPGGQGFDPFKNPKPLSFSWNFKGDPNLVTVDTHAFRAPAMLGEDPRFLERSFKSEKGTVPRNIQREFEQGDISMDTLKEWGPGWQSKPQQNEYGAWEDYYRRIASELGIAPAEAQAAGWVGHGQMTGLESAPKSAMDFIEERILKTARERGMDPADVWREAIRGARPLTRLEDQSPAMQGTSMVG